MGCDTVSGPLSNMGCTYVTTKFKLLKKQFEFLIRVQSLQVFTDANVENRIRDIIFTNEYEEQDRELLNFLRIKYKNK